MIIIKFGGEITAAAEFAIVDGGGLAVRFLRHDIFVSVGVWQWISTS